jgi:hypothetical protein
VVDAVPEGQVVFGFAPDVEEVGLVPASLVAVGGAVEEMTGWPTGIWMPPSSTSRVVVRLKFCWGASKRRASSIAAGIWEGCAASQDRWSGCLASQYRALVMEQPTFSNPPTDVAAARQQVADQQVALAHLVAGLGANRPIIFKLWNTAAAAEVRRVLLRSGATNLVQQRAAIATSVPFRDAVIEAMASTWNSVGTLLERFAKDPVAPFRFPALIDDTLAALHVGEGDFATRAARDRVADERPGADLAVVSTWLGHVGLVGLTGAPPLEVVAAVAMVAQLAVDAIALVGKGFRLYEQHLGTDAFFAPSAALAVDPTYSALAVDVYLLILNILLL